jgi:hypothetical protein
MFPLFFRDIFWGSVTIYSPEEAYNTQTNHLGLRDYSEIV